MIETKVLRVKNNETSINDTGRERACFGWIVTNVQITHSENTKTYSSVWDQIGGNQTQTVETNIVDYATMTLQRDTSIPHYAELKALEREFEECLANEENLAEQESRSDKMGCLYFLFWPWSMFFKKKLQASQSNLESSKQQAAQRRDDILRKAENLLK